MFATLTESPFNEPAMDDDSFYRQFGQLVREHRLRMGANQASIAELAGLSRASIANVETGRQRIPLHQLYNLARALQVDPHALLPPSASEAIPSEEFEINSSMTLSDSQQREVARVLGRLGSGNSRKRKTS
jgi:transcriptional regulator with XRE-family HTH domain